MNAGPMPRAARIDWRSKTVFCSRKGLDTRQLETAGDITNNSIKP